MKALQSELLITLISVAMFAMPFAICARDSTNAAVVLQQSSVTNAANTLKQYVVDWQKEPGDNLALLEKIVKLAATITNPPPEIPEEARRHAVKGETEIKQAKEKSDFRTAADEFRQALRIAPWWADAYKDLSSAAESAGDFDKAEAALKLYLASNPDDARAAQDKIYQIQAEKDLEAKHVADEQAKVQHKAAEAQERAQHILAGRWDFGNKTLPQQIIISGSDGNYQGGFTRQWSSGNVQLRAFKANGRNVTFSLYFDSGPGTYWAVDDYSLSLSDDGNKLAGTFSFRSNNPVTQPHNEDATLSRQ